MVDVITPPSVSPPAPQAASPAPAISDAASVVAPISVDTAPSPIVADKTAAPEAVVESTVLGNDPVKMETPPEKVEDKAPDAKADEAKEPEVAETKKEEGSQSDEPAPLPSYEFKMPDGISFDEAKLGEFTKELGELQNLTKADQATMQEFGQKLVERHVAEVQETVNRLNEYYANAWEKQKNEWKESFEKDPEIGGTRINTTVQAAKEFLRTHGGTTEQQKEFSDLMNKTGIGNHPAMIRLLAKANTAMSEGKPLPASKPAPQATSRVAKRYGSK